MNLLRPTEADKKRRQAEFDAGRKVDYKIGKNSEVRVFGNTAVNTFYRIGTVKEINEAPKPSHLRISGVWVRQADGWKLAHRHESTFRISPSHNELPRILRRVYGEREKGSSVLFGYGRILGNQCPREDFGNRGGRRWRVPSSLVGLRGASGS